MNLVTNKNPERASRCGFALIASISIMAVLVMIGVALFSISSVATKSADIAKARTEAQANAKTGLMVAIGELQAQLGPDQRISASAAIRDTDPTSSTINGVRHPHWLGVWDSWIAGDLASSPVNADYPRVPSQHQTIGSADENSVLHEGMHPEYGQKDSYFRGWLVSLDPDLVDDSAPNLPEILDLPGNLRPENASTAVRLVGEGSLGSSAGVDQYVSAALLGIRDGATAPTGRYAWWVGDQSQKASILSDSYDSETGLSGAERIYRSQAPASMGNELVEWKGNTLDESKLGKLSNLNSLDLITQGSAAGDEFADLNFHSATVGSLGVLADVREGGLKRDLSTLLERPINLDEDSDEFMLYAFDDPRFPYQNNPNDDNRANSRVPIQDLAAYYQLYDHQPDFDDGRRGGVHYSSSSLSNSPQIDVPDYDGGSKNQDFLIREYTSLYRRPVVTKIQFLVGITAEPITQAERDWVKGVVDGTIPFNETWAANMDYIRDSDTHKVKLGIQPLVTLWNPGNLPLVMEANQLLTYGAPPIGFKYLKYRAEGEDFESNWMNLGYANNAGGGTSAGQAGGALLRLRLANDTIVFEPGEVKVFSIPSSTASNLADNSDTTLELGNNTMDVVNEWDPFGLFLMRNSAPVDHNARDSPDVYFFNNNGQRAQTMVFNPNDRISISIDSERRETATSRGDGRNASRHAEIKGAGFSLYLFDEGYRDGHWSTWADALRHDILISRHGSQSNENRQELGGFYQNLMLPGFPGGQAPIEFDDADNAIAGSQLVAAGNVGEIIALMDFSLSIGCESPSSAAGGSGGGRRITSRPFLHSATTALPFIAEADEASLYDYGMDWQVSKINAVEDSILQAKPGTGNGYYGGGYTVELGTTQVIQSEIPVLPPISIASFSHAYLGGYSLAKAVPVGEDPENDAFWVKSDEVEDPTGVSFQRTTASGQNGLAPNIAQAIGNSYAHPNIPADSAFVTKERLFDLDEGSFDIPYVDHSYLANKALWDEFFFSSIAPQPVTVPLFETGLSAEEVAENFFQLDGASPSAPLPNRRLKPHRSNLDQEKLDELFAETALFTGGFADKIASYLMVEGSFNVNSTSVEAWKTFLSSLKGVPVAYLDSGVDPDASITDGTTFNPFGLPNDPPIRSATIQNPNNPVEQWTAGRELTDEEIGRLAEALVKQVKLRGPFLSLSEFVNRQLRDDDSELSAQLAVKGALQAALDDPDVPINANFRESSRTLDAESEDISFQFQEAAEGPIAYGSAPYVDQADILRSFAGQLTPRGDTFVIRAYGDSLNATGEVEARVWCEAVVQRIPDYVDTSDAAHLRTEEVNDNNRKFGRSFVIKSFRWLDPEEV